MANRKQKITSINQKNSKKKYCTILRKNVISAEIYDKNNLIPLYSAVTHDKQVINAGDVLELEKGIKVIVGTIIRMNFFNYYYLGSWIMLDKDDLVGPSGIADECLYKSDGSFFWTYIKPWTDERMVIDIDDYIECRL